MIVWYSHYHLFKFELKPRKLGFFYLITLFFCSCLIYLFRFYTSVTLLTAPFTSFFIVFTLLFFYIFSLLPSVFSFFFSISFLSVVLCPSIFYHAFLYIPYYFFPISFSVSFHSFFLLRAFFLSFSVIFILYLCFINFILPSVCHSLVSFVLSAPLFRPYFQYSI